MRWDQEGVTCHTSFVATILPSKSTISVSYQHHCGPTNKVSYLWQCEKTVTRYNETQLNLAILPSEKAMKFIKFKINKFQKTLVPSYGSFSQKKEVKGNNASKTKPQTDICTIIYWHQSHNMKATEQPSSWQAHWTHIMTIFQTCITLADRLVFSTHWLRVCRFFLFITGKTLTIADPKSS